MRTLILSGAAAAALIASPVSAQSRPDGEPPRESTAFTLATDQPRTVEQEAMRFDLADLTFRVLPETRSIEARAALTFTATAPLDALVVELDTVFDVASVTVDGVEVPAGRWTNLEGRMTVPLAAPLAPGRSAVLAISYSGRPRAAPRAPWDGGFQWAETPDGRPWIATAVQGEGCDVFWPCIDSPLSEPARVDLHITVPPGLSAPSGGRLVGVERHADGWSTWNWTARQPNTYAVALNIGPYAVKEAVYQSRFGNAFPMQYWHLDGDDPAQVQALFDQFRPMLDFYEATVGPYPFGDEKMGVVETPHLGMEHQTLNAYGNGYRLDGKGYDWLLHHELAHEWFGNQMTNVNADDMWLHEGLSSYMQPLYLRWVNGERGMQAELQEQRLGVANRFPIVSGRPQDEDQVYFGGTGPGNDIYVKGSLIAHSLRMLIGDRAFFTAVTRLVYGAPDPRPGRFQPRSASTPEFQRLASEEAGRDLEWFFRGYLYNAALPVLGETRTGDRLSLTWTTRDGRPFPMPVEVEVDGWLHTLPMTDGRGEIALEPHSVVVIDPSSKVLREQAFVTEFRADRERRRAVR